MILTLQFDLSPAGEAASVTITGYGVSMTQLLPRGQVFIHAETAVSNAVKAVCANLEKELKAIREGHPRPFKHQPFEYDSDRTGDSGNQTKDTNNDEKP